MPIASIGRIIAYRGLYTSKILILLASNSRAVWLYASIYYSTVVQIKLKSLISRAYFLINQINDNSTDSTDQSECDSV